MTIGQRIAEKRKELGLSQEALGEKLGVSRQAISKWESDTSVPEIDKLIVLSKLFGVSVGWLLGVEATPEISTEVPVSEPETQESIRQWFLRWLKGWEIPASETDASPSRSRELLRSITPKRLGIILLILTQLYLCLWVVRIYNIAHDTQIQAMIAKSAADNAQADLEALRASLRRQQESQLASGPLLSDYSFDIDPESNVLKATVTFCAVPHSWQEGNRGYLCIGGKGVEPLEIPCQWDGAFARCAAVLDLTGSLELCFALEYDDGSRQFQLLSNEPLKNAAYTQPPIVSGSIGGIQYHPDRNAVLLKALDANFHWPEVYADTEVSWQAQAILLLADGQEAARINHFDANTHPKDSSHTSSGSGLYIGEKLLSNVTLSEGQTLELVLYAELSNGLFARDVIGSWTVGTDGDLIPS